MADLLKTRKRMALEVAEAIEGHFLIGDRRQKRWDADVAAQIVASHLPLSYAEAEEEWERMNREQDGAAALQPRQPSIFGRLREALDLRDPKVTAVQLIEAAIERLTGRS